MDHKFSSQIINSTLQTVLNKYNLKPKHLMSTSGEFLVMTLKRNEKKFLIKMRKNQGTLAKKKIINEINVIKYLYKKSVKNLITPKILITQTDKSPEYFIYEYIEGYPLNSFYIAIGKRLTNKFLQTNFIQILNNLHTLKIPANIKLQKYNFSKNFQIFKKNKVYLKKYIDKNFLRKINNLLINQNYFLNKTPLVLTHGDINPKNIVLAKKNIALIDWSEVHLNNPLFDLSSLYLFAWNRSEIKKQIKNYILNNCYNLPNAYHVFLLNRLILIPRNIRIMENSIQGLILDRKNKIILPETETKLKKTAKQAIISYIDEIKRIVEHLELWQKPNSIVKSIEKFCNYTTANKFFLNHKNKLKLNQTWKLKKINTHRLIVRQDDQKLITEYLFTNGKKNKILIGKIRLERKDDLAKQSYQIIKKLWEAPGGKQLISQPLYYFPKQHIYFYEKTLGTSLADLIENKKNQNKKFLKPLIKESAEVMSKLHKIPVKYFNKIKFYKNYDLYQQLKFLTENINKHKKFKNKKNTDLLKNLSALHKKIAKLRNQQLKFIHGDFQLQNIILYQKKIKLIDFDNVEISDPFIDVGNFINQINYKNLLYKNSYFLRKLFLQTYLRLTQQKLNKTTIRALNFYIIMGIIKNINLNFLENNHQLVVYDLKKINYLYHHLTNDPIDNLHNAKKY